MAHARQAAPARVHALSLPGVAARGGRGRRRGRGGEISTGTRGGIGRLVIEYSREATADPAKVYTAMVGAALLGLAVAALVGIAEFALSRRAA
ncbi:hypothetical protein [Phytohabitans flavus]|uniref:hypothetical protein n=1 Tax=Phytohabitans flavus TaxID=1076124 RepID=UPI001E4B875E|nr:hypothetical protein [Phytohabitans flavus]